jgi:hypothetical protein
VVIVCLQEALKAQKENGNTNTSKNPSLSGVHLKKMLNVSPQQPRIKQEKRKAKLKAEPTGLDEVNQSFYSLCAGKNLYLKV